MDIIEEIEQFYKSYAGEKGIIGYSLKNRPIYYFCVFKTEFPVIIVSASIHAREYITAHLALKLIEDYLRAGQYGKVYFIPMLNPDGVKIALTENPLYKANARGVDLNVNFDARWGRGEKNVRRAGAENYIGAYPFSEPETMALKDFTLKVKPQITLSYHSKGEEIYYSFYQNSKDKKRDYKLAKIISKKTGYKIVTPIGSVGGYKDWCIEKLNVSAFTIEVGDDNLSHPIKKERLAKIYAQNKGVISALTKAIKKEDYGY